MKGIDVSGNGKIDFKALKAAGYEFAIFRAGYGSTIKQTDKGFHAHVGDALSAGLHVGAYWFIYARSVAEAEVNANAFLEVIEPWKGRLDMPMYIDYEYDSTRYYQEQTGKSETIQSATNIIRAAAAVVEENGYFTGVYLNPDYIKRHVNIGDLERYTLWLAEWKTGRSSPSYICGMWQTDGDAHIPQANSPVDLNVCYTDFPTIIRKRGLNGFKPDAAPQACGYKRTGDYWEVVDDGSGLLIKLGGSK